MKIKFIVLFVIILFVSCNKVQKTKENNIKTKNNVNMLSSKISELFRKASIDDSLNFNNILDFKSYKEFLSYKSGYFLNKDEKNALLVTCPTDTTYNIKLYSFQSGKWSLSDSISEIDAFQTQFETNFEDYNFDGQKDIYLQVSVSNGWSLSRGHLIIINPKTKKMELHNETRDFANMKPDFRTKTVKSELWDGYDDKGRIHLTILTNKWVNGKLTTIRKENSIIETKK